MGLDIVSGMHARLATNPQLAVAAERYNRRLAGVRTPPQHIPIACGRKRSGKFRGGAEFERLLDRYLWAT